MVARATDDTTDEWQHGGVRSSYLQKCDYGVVFRSLASGNPSLIVEIGVLDGFSLRNMAQVAPSCCRIEAYDLFGTNEKFKGKHSPLSIIEELNRYSNCKLEKGDFYELHQKYDNGTIDILHVDIANDGSVYEFALEHWMPKLSKVGVLILEGGSTKRDEVGWMVTHEKPKMVPVLARYSEKFSIHVLTDDCPTLTLVRHKSEQLAKAETPQAQQMLSCFKVFMAQELDQELLATIHSGFITQGPKVEEYESLLRAYFDHEHVLSLNSATAALTLAMRMLLEPNESLTWPGFDKETDVVLTPVLTCFATTSSILINHCKLRWVDVDLDTGNICLRDLESKISARTKVIYLVHWGGTPVDLDALDAIRERCFQRFGFRPMVVEDCAHAFGAEYRGKDFGVEKIGKCREGHLCAFSTQAIKHLTTGDGGILTVPTSAYLERAILLRWFGIDRNKRNYKGKDFRLENDIEEVGYKFHMNDINAQIGIVNLRHMPRLLERHRENAAFFDANLRGPDFEPEIVILKTGSLSAFWLYTIRVTEQKLHFIEFMKEKKIMTTQVHNRNDINTCTREFQEPLPQMDVMEQQMICIPVGWWITNSDRAYIVAAIGEFVQKVRGRTS